MKKGETLLQAAARIIKERKIVSDVREQDDLIKKLRDAGHDRVHVAMMEVKKESKSGNPIIVHKPALNRADFLELLKPLCDV